jgi:glycosyltransferase involved in cell wall biosynthesis
MSVQVVLIDDHSVDDTRAIALDIAAEVDWLEVVAGEGHGEAAARTAGADLLFQRNPGLTWVIAADVDQSYEPGWLASWIEAIGDSTVGAIGGRDRISGESARRHPHAAIVLAELELLTVRIESVVGLTNLNGHNHAVSRNSYAAAGPYRQVFRSLSPGAPVVPIVGADWDLGVRLRRLGHPLRFHFNATVYEGRRFHEAPLDVVSGQTYNRAFGNTGRSYVGEGTVGVQTSTTDDLDAARLLGIRKALLHHMAKPLIVVPALIDRPAFGPVLGSELWSEMRNWLATNPASSFDDDRDDTLLRVGPAFVDSFLAPLCAAFDTPL